MSNKPLVSIITPCYNGEKFLDRYFNAILSQTYDNLELIFVNDGSIDLSYELALSYKDKLEQKGIKTVYIEQENSGIAAAINAGLKNFHGDFLIWPDCDDCMPPNYVGELVKYLLAHPDKGFVLSKCVRVFEGDIDKITDKYERQNKESGFMFDDLILERDIYWAAGGYMLRREAFLRANPDCEIYESACGQNYQMLLPISYFYECGFNDTTEYKIIARPGSMSRTQYNYFERIRNIDIQEKTVMETILKINMPKEDLDKYKKIVLLKYLNRRFDLSFYYGKKEDSKEYYNKLKQQNGLTASVKIKYILVKNHLLFKCYKVLRSIKRKIKKLSPVKVC